MGAWAVGAERTPRLLRGALPWLVVAGGLSIGCGLLSAGAAWAAVSLVLVVAGALAILRFPFQAMVVLLALRTASKSTFLDVLTLGAGGLALLVAAPRVPGRRALLPLAALLLFALPGVPLAPSPDEGAHASWLVLPKLPVNYLPQPSVEMLQWMRLASVLVAFGLAAWSVRDARRLRVLGGAVLVSALVPLAIALKQLATGQLFVRDGFRAIEGPFTHPNYFAFYLVIVLSVGLVAFMEARTLQLRLGLAALLAVAFACLLETYTRGAWIGFAGVVLILAVLRYRQLFVLGALTLVLGAFAFPASVHKVEARFGDHEAQTASNSGDSWAWRRGEWRRMVHYGSQKPFTGQGFGSYSRLTVKEFGTEDPHYPTLADPAHPARSAEGFAAHNDYVKMFVETGAPGVALWVLFLVGLLLTALRAARTPSVAPWACAGVGVAAALIVMSAADNIQGYTVVLVYAATLVGAVAGAARGETCGTAS